MATTTLAATQETTQELVYRDFINNYTGGGAISITATKIDHDVLGTYINLNHVRQYTPSSGFLNGLYALEISLQAICIKLGRTPVVFDELRTIYTSDVYKNAAAQLVGYSGDVGHYNQLLQELTSTANLSLHALRLVLALYAAQQGVRIRLGVVTWCNDIEGRIWRAATYPEIVPSQFTGPPFTVWIVDDARWGTANVEKAACHWSGLAPAAVYAPSQPVAPPMAKFEYMMDYSQSDGMAFEAPEPVPARPRAESIVSPVNQPEVPDDLARARTHYPSHLTPEEVLDKYPERLTMETLLYVLLRYRQNELLVELQQRDVNINSEALRQRKKAALDNRAKNLYGAAGAKQRYKDVSKAYNEEIQAAGFYGPRAERGEGKSKRNRQTNDDNDDEERSRPRRSINFASTDYSKPRPGPTQVQASEGTIDPFDLSYGGPEGEYRPYYGPGSIDGDTSDEGTPTKVSRPSKKKQKQPIRDPNWAPAGMQQAYMFSTADMPPLVVPNQTTYPGDEGMIAPPPVDPSQQDVEMSDADFAALVQAANESIEAAKAALPPTPPKPVAVLAPSGRALSNYFTRAYPHRNGSPDPTANNGRGSGPPGSATWFKWPENRQPPELTLEQIEWYFLEGRDKRLLPKQKQQLHDMRQERLDEQWYKNQSKTPAEQAALGQALAVNKHTPKAGDASTTINASINISVDHKTPLSPIREETTINQDTDDLFEGEWFI